MIAKLGAVAGTAAISIVLGVFALAVAGVLAWGLLVIGLDVATAIAPALENAVHPDRHTPGR